MDPVVTGGKDQVPPLETTVFCLSSNKRVGTPSSFSPFLFPSVKCFKRELICSAIGLLVEVDDCTVVLVGIVVVVVVVVVVEIGILVVILL